VEQDNHSASLQNARAHIVVAGDGFDGPHFKNPLARIITYGNRIWPAPRIDIVPPPVFGANRGRTSQPRQMLPVLEEGEKGNF